MTEPNDERFVWAENEVHYFKDDELVRTMIVDREVLKDLNVQHGLDGQQEVEDLIRMMHEDAHNGE